MTDKIKKIVIPVAGYGTRFLPFTKSIPKEMLPIIDRPVIQYIVEEAVEAGIEEVILITGYSKRAIEDYFDYNLELEYLLDHKGKTAEKQLIRDISDIAKFIYVRQKEQLGTGHALLQVKELINDEPFMVVSGDDIWSGNPSRLQLLRDSYYTHQSPVLLSLEKTQPEDYNQYGYIKTGEQLDDKTWTVNDLIEKPGPDRAHLVNKASFIGYVLTPDIFPHLENLEPGKGGEIWLTDAIHALAQEQRVVTVDGTGLNYYDCGNKLEYLKAVTEFALNRPDLKDAFRSYLKGLDL
jgi:UTP--glucose-1-phosphate uridylyltransferase